MRLSTTRIQALAALALFLPVATSQAVETVVQNVVDVVTTWVEATVVASPEAVSPAPEPTTSISTTPAALFYAPPSTTSPSPSMSTAVVASSSSVAPSAASSTSIPDLASQILNSTNVYRQQYQATSLVWNDTLADYASSYVSTCIWKHSGGPYGENIAAGYATVASAVDAWGNEEAQYNWGEQGFSEATGHFTQLVWKSTTSVGCALIQCDNTKDQGGIVNSFLACEYSPRGNMGGEYATNVRKRGIADDGTLGLGAAAGSGVKRSMAAVVIAAALWMLV